MSAGSSALTNPPNKMAVPESSRSDSELLRNNLYINPGGTNNPLDLFEPGSHMLPFRFSSDPLWSIRPVPKEEDSKQALVFCSGALGNISPTNPMPHAGCAVIVNSDRTIQFRLEEKGPDRITHQPSAGRAHLRAVVAALSEPWESLFTSVIIATNSPYISRCGSNNLGILLQNEWMLNPPDTIPD
ncbi:hypothetical protein ACMFMG_006820 [Clarireedia jacksonii]